MPWAARELHGCRDAAQVRSGFLLLPKKSQKLSGMSGACFSCQSLGGTGLYGKNLCSSTPYTVFPRCTHLVPTQSGQPSPQNYIAMLMSPFLLFANDSSRFDASIVLLTICSSQSLFPALPDSPQPEGEPRRLLSGGQANKRARQPHKQKADRFLWRGRYCERC